MLVSGTGLHLADTQYCLRIITGVALCLPADGNRHHARILLELTVDVFSIVDNNCFVQISAQRQ